MSCNSILSTSVDTSNQLSVKLTSGSIPVPLVGWCTSGSKTSWIDFNKDSKLDLVCDTDRGTHHVLLNNGDSLLSMTGDMSSQISVKFTHSSSPVELTGWCTSGSKASWIDFNNDGKLDLACHTDRGTHHVLLNNGDTLLSMTGDLSSQLSLKLTSSSSPVVLTGWCINGGTTSWVDFNKDGKLDLLCDNRGTHHVLLNDGDTLLSKTGDLSSQISAEELATISSSPVVPTGWCAGGAISWIDFNSDGKLDLACDTVSGTHHVLLNDQLLSFLSPNGSCDN